MPFWARGEWAPNVRMVMAKMGNRRNMDKKCGRNFGLGFGPQGLGCLFHASVVAGLTVRPAVGRPMINNPQGSLFVTGLPYTCLCPVSFHKDYRNGAGFS